MSTYSNKTTLSLLNMTHKMLRKNIEISRIVKVATMLLMAGLSTYDIEWNIVDRCLKNQKEDGGFIGNSDTIWNIKFLGYYPETFLQRKAALMWLKQGNGDEPGYGRGKRDMHRIPVTGLALYLIPEVADVNTLKWLENIWLSEKNSLTYKAAYTLLAFKKNNYIPENDFIIKDTVSWLVSQQQKSGGFAPWYNHPVGENVYCTAIVLIALINQNDPSLREVIVDAYNYLCSTQLKSGVWAYHEIEDGAGWGLLALTESEIYLRRCQADRVNRKS